jgi:1,2-diacylglycerol 3-alpha-glucosyltransferase
MRIFITVPNFPPFNSGLGNATALQARMLSGHGAEVVVCTGGEQRSSERSPQGYFVERFSVSGARWLGNPIRGDDGKYLAFLKSSKADLLLMNAWQTWSTDIPLEHLSELPGRKVLYSHGLATDVWIPSQPLRSAIRYALWRPYRWRVVSKLRALDGLLLLAETGCDVRFDDAVLAKKLNIPRHVVPNAVPDYALAGQAYPRSYDQRRTLIDVGSLEIAKGHDFVLRAYAASKAMNRLPLQLLGQQETPLVPALQALGRSLGITDGMLTIQVGVSGAVLFERYRQALGLISGSHTECQPLILLDAMAAGTPFVARATGCIPFMRGGVAVETIKEAASAINALFDENHWQVLSQAGHEAASTTYHPSKVSDQLWSALQGFVNKRSRP